MMVKDIDKGWVKLKMQLRLADKSYVVIGFPAGKVAPLDLKKAIWNEWGTKVDNKQRIPPRPFMRYTFKKYLNKTFGIQKSLHNNLLKGIGTVDKGLIRIGMTYAGFMKLAIRTGPWIENAPSTLKRKKGSKPLINEREMLRAITHKVFKKVF